MQADERIDRPLQRQMHRLGRLRQLLVLRKKRQPEQVEETHRMVARGGENIAADRHGKKDQIEQNVGSPLPGRIPKPRGPRAEAAADSRARQKIRKATSAKIVTPSDLWIMKSVRTQGLSSAIDVMAQAMGRIAKTRSAVSQCSHCETWVIFLGRDAYRKSRLFHHGAKAP